VYNRLPLLPDVPLGKVLELGRFVKNQLLSSLDDLAIRAPVEIGVGLHRVLSGKLSGLYEAVVGDLEEDVAKRNLDFFHCPTVVIHGTVACVADDAYKFPMYQQRNHYPFAFLISDLWGALPRLASIERALALPRAEALRALSVLKADTNPPRSSLEPAGGLTPLNAADLPQRRAAMPLRRKVRQKGDHLRTVGLFRDLSVPEATVLATLMEIRRVDAGEVLIRRGEDASGLFIIEAGWADVLVRPYAGAPRTVAALGPGDVVGEMALLSGTACTADVVARTPMTVLRLSREDYERYLSGIPEVERRLWRTAAGRAYGVLRHIAAADEGTGAESRVTRAEGAHERP